MKLRQEVWYDVKFNSGRHLSGLVEGTNTNNILSKITAKVQDLVIQHVFTEGAVISFRLTPAEKDELANPER